MQNQSLNIQKNINSNTNTKNNGRVHFNDDDDNIVPDDDDKVFNYRYRQYHNNEQPGTWQYYAENIKENINH